MTMDKENLSKILAAAEMDSKIQNLVRQRQQCLQKIADVAGRGENPLKEDQDEFDQLETQIDEKFIELGVPKNKINLLFNKIVLLISSRS